MSSEKLRTYLTYYRKILREEPENIEARLRLAALFREMERPNQAVEEYVMAAKLLANEGLPLEAIAACKAILELDPSHQETQFFLARLYARVPEATGDSVRVARPLSPAGEQPGSVGAGEARSFAAELERANGGQETSGASLQLPEIPLFSQLPRPAFLDFLDAMELRELPKGFELLHADDPRACIYIVIRGQVRVEKTLMDGRVVELARMGEGQVFGEFRLLTGKGGAARVVADTEVELLEVADEVVYRIGRQYPVVWDVLWGFYFERMLNHSMATSTIFAELSDEERALVVRHFVRRDLKAGEALFYQGEHVEVLSLIVNGMVNVEISGGRGREVVDTLEEGVFLGVSPCAQRVPARATAIAVTDLVLLEMPAPIFRELIYGLPDVAAAVQRVIHDRRAKVMGLSVGSPSELV